MEILRKQAAAEEASASMAYMSGMDADAAGQADVSSQYFARAAQHYANAKRLLNDAANFELKIPDIKLPGASGGRGASSAFKATEAYEKAKDAAEQLRLKNIELKEQLSGDANAAFTKIAREYKAQLDSIEKSERAFEEPRGLCQGGQAGYLRRRSKGVGRPESAPAEKPRLE